MGDITLKDKNHALNLCDLIEAENQKLMDEQSNLKQLKNKLTNAWDSNTADANDAVSRLESNANNLQNLCMQTKLMVSSLRSYINSLEIISDNVIE